MPINLNSILLSNDQLTMWIHARRISIKLSQ